MAEKTGKLLRGGGPDVNNVCKSIITDWQRGNIPFFNKAPNAEETAKEKAALAEKPVIQGETELLAKPVMADAVKEEEKV